MLVNATNMLLKARDGHYGVGQFNINNLEWTRSILLQAQAMQSPVILGVSEGAGKYMTGFKTVAAMVRAAITEVDGVAGVATSTGTELAELLGIKSAAKGIKVQIVDGTMTVDTIITVRYGCSVVAVAKAVQESVTSAVESMTGMGKPIVNVHVSGVAFDK